MRFNIMPKLISFLVIVFQISCQQNPNQENYYSTIDQRTLDLEANSKGLSENHNQIDLSLSTLEQQNIDKLKAAQKLEDARKDRIEIEVRNSENDLYDVNVAKFARDTNHKKGQKKFARSNFSSYNNWNECTKFNTKDDAQRKFLRSGGPYIDKFNLDPDGDGFACEWDPEVYRELSIPKD
tara:strand:- start:61 stop:603 length:543 start_codon:yes stop_codon:yes gene_type:complete